jgi:hypothetical protein
MSRRHGDPQFAYEGRSARVRKKIEEVSRHDNVERLRSFGGEEEPSNPARRLNYLISRLSLARAYAARIIEKSGDAVFLEPLCNVRQVGLLGEVELQTGQVHTHASASRRLLPRK